MQKNRVYLSFGSNLGDRLYYLNLAIERIEKGIGSLIKRSSVYESEAWGFDAGHFLNQCVLIETKYDEVELIALLQGIEKKAGREKKQGKEYVSRELDIDILFFNDWIVDKKSLRIPHPLLHERLFVLVPLNEIAAEFVHPVLKKSVGGILKECEKKDKTSIDKV